MTLMERLNRLAGIWSRESGRSLSRLSTVVVNDGKLFDRIAAGGSCTIATYERMVDHLSDPDNWPADIPAEAAALLPAPAKRAAA